ncbi:MAG: sensor histidine kinase [Bacteroidota bacterium]
MRRGPFFRRVGCFFALLSILGGALFLSVLGWVLSLLGVTRTGQVPWLLPAAAAGSLFVLGFLIMLGRNLRRWSMPLDEMLAASNRVAEGDYSARVEEKGPPEIRSLARSFNSMASRLHVSDQQRRRMLADVTHELRTPLTVIQGNVEGLLDGLYSPSEEILRSILDETQLLSRLVDDLRTLALAESGALQLEKESTDLAALVRETAGSFQSRAEAGGVRLEVDAPDPVIVDVDPTRIREVLSNLISNALRYTPRGGTVQIRCQDGVVTVLDNGPGIAPEEMPHIFERFYRSRDSGGMGLGLSIAKYLVEAHGGEIHAESLAGQGTTISFKLPR